MVRNILQEPNEIGAVAFHPAHYVTYPCVDSPAKWIVRPVQTGCNGSVEHMGGEVCRGTKTACTQLAKNLNRLIRKHQRAVAEEQSMRCRLIRNPYHR